MSHRAVLLTGWIGLTLAQPILVWVGVKSPAAALDDALDTAFTVGVLAGLDWLYCRHWKGEGR